MEKITHVWGSGYRFKADPEKVWQEMEVIREKNGGVLTTKLLLKSARRKSSSLYDDLIWDDSEAANRYRLSQIASAIRGIRVIVESDEEDEEPVTTRVNINPMNDGNYYTIAHVMGDEELRQGALKKVLKELQALRDKYAEYEKLFGILQGATEQVASEITG